MNRIQFGPENTNLIQEAMREFPPGRERDNFIYKLSGVMLCYLEVDTLRRCIEVAKKGYQKVSA
jgi:hypothetical protein